MKRILIASVLIAGLLSACQPQGGAGDKVRIGVFMSTTGTTANFGISSVNGIKLAAEEANAAGGINGKQVELLVQDDRSDPSEAATIVTKFVNQDMVNAVIGEVASSRSLAAAPIAQNATIPKLRRRATSSSVVASSILIRALRSHSLPRRLSARRLPRSWSIARTIIQPDWRSTSTKPLPSSAARSSPRSRTRKVTRTSTRS